MCCRRQYNHSPDWRGSWCVWQYPTRSVDQVVEDETSNVVQELVAELAVQDVVEGQVVKFDGHPFILQPVINPSPPPVLFRFISDDR